ncbi:MAG: two-component system chemotaxis family response regulator CheY [Stygiobacter sp.]|nr:MAG: two-component system chemotaxis family response regulator CheY [Stygiobacter sp.]
MKILIADNNARMREFIKYIINEQGHTAVEASNGLMAVDNFIFHKPEVVLMDIKMDVMDGIEATRLIRKISPSVKIIMVTDYNEEPLKLKALKAGANDYLLKEELLRLKNMLNTNYPT